MEAKKEILTRRRGDAEKKVRCLYVGAQTVEGRWARSPIKPPAPPRLRANKFFFLFAPSREPNQRGSITISLVIELAMKQASCAL